MDKVMIGILSNVTEVGYYEQAEKLVSIPMAFVTTLGVVMLPKMSYLVKKEKHDLILNYIEKAIHFTMFLIFPICLGLMAVSSDLVSVLLGDSFMKSASLINLLAISTIFISFVNVIRRQYLLPFEKDYVFIKSVIIGAIVNFILNIILIPKYASVGACISTLLTEFLVMFVQIKAVKKALPIRNYLVSIIPFFYKAVLMFAIVVVVRNLAFSSIVTVALQILLGVFVYFGLNIGFVRKLFFSEKNKKRLEY